MTLLEEPSTEVVNPLEAVHARAARIIQRAASSLHVPDEDWSYAAAGVVLSLPEIAAGRRAQAAMTVLGPRLAALDARHQPRDYAGSSTGTVCTCGRGAYPCPERRLLDGDLPEPEEP